MTTIPTTAARLCRSCRNLVTDYGECPLCSMPTIEHPEAKATEHYCMECAQGPFPASGMHLVTWNEDPYQQDEDGDLIAVCAPCAKAQIEEAL